MLYGIWTRRKALSLPHALHPETPSAILIATMHPHTLEKSELVTLKLENGHRKETDILRDEYRALLEEKDRQIATLNEEKLSIAHCAARMLCPKKKLAQLDSLFKPLAIVKD